jgi:hypothetical protein
VREVLLILVLLQSFLFANDEIITVTNGNGSKNTFSQRVYEYGSGREQANKCVHSAGATAINIRVGAKIVNDESAWNYFHQNPFNVSDNPDDRNGLGLMRFNDWMNAGNHLNIPDLEIPQKVTKFTKDNFLNIVKKNIKLNIPMIIALDAYGAIPFKNIYGYKELQKYDCVGKNCGHAVTIVGYINNKNLIAIRDPFSSDTKAKKDNEYYKQFDYVISLDNLFIYLQTKQLLPFKTNPSSSLVDNKKHQLVVFKDINYKTTNKLHKNAITYLKEQKIVKGYADGTYRPNNTITRAEFLKIALLSRYKESDIKFKKNHFTDADIDDGWARKYINFAKEHHILEGYTDGSFGVSDKITFAQASKIIVNLFEIDSDHKWGKENQDDWYADYVYRLWMAYKITYEPRENYYIYNGDEITYDPYHLITRGEMAFMIATVKGAI